MKQTPVPSYLTHSFPFFEVWLNLFVSSSSAIVWRHSVTVQKYTCLTLPHTLNMLFMVSHQLAWEIRNILKVKTVGKKWIKCEATSTETFLFPYQKECKVSEMIIKAASTNQLAWEVCLSSKWNIDWRTRWQRTWIRKVISFFSVSGNHICGACVHVYIMIIESRLTTLPRSNSLSPSFFYLNVVLWRIRGSRPA